MQTLDTWGGRSTFSYQGSVRTDTTLSFGENRKQRVTAEQYQELLAHFRGKTVKVGTSRSNPPPNSLGEWLQAHVTKTAIASYVAPILVQEDYANRPDDTSQISFND